MRFLEPLSNWFTKLLARDPRYVARDGDIARFVFQSRDLYKDGTPKPKAFAPERHPESGQFETSVCGLNGVTYERVWYLGRTIRATSGLTALAALELAVERIVSVGLRCDAAPERPHYPEHGVICGWDSDPDAKDRRLAIQQELAAAVPQERVKRPPNDRHVT